MTQQAETETDVPRSEGATWTRNLALFLATVGSVFLTGVLQFSQAQPDKNDVPEVQGFLGDLVTAVRQIGWTLQHARMHDVISGAQFVGTVLSILVAHEMGHYVAARIHKVDASLPFFIPMPVLSPFGTMGAVIRMRGHIPTRRALLDIGAAGPLAGMLFAIPLYAWGVHHSHTVPLASTEDSFQLGESVLVHALDHFFAPAVGEDMTVVYSPVAFGAWGGFFITMINMFPVAQLDGGHVAFALFGPRQNRYAQLVHRAMLAFFFVIVAGHLGRDVQAGRALDVTHLGRYIGNAFSWLVWFQLLAVLGTVSSRAIPGREDDPGPPGALSVRTRVVITVGLGILASMGRTHGSWPVVGGFLAALGLLIAMEIRGGVLRRHDLLDHPPTGSQPLDGKRKAVAVCTLLMFALLFMPESFSL